MATLPPSMRHMVVIATPTPRACVAGGALTGSKLSERDFVRRISVGMADICVGAHEERQGGILLAAPRSGESKRLGERESRAGTLFARASSRKFLLQSKSSIRIPTTVRVTSLFLQY